MTPEELHNSCMAQCGALTKYDNKVHINPCTFFSKDEYTAFTRPTAGHHQRARTPSHVLLSRPGSPLDFDSPLCCTGCLDVDRSDRWHSGMGVFKLTTVLWNSLPYHAASRYRIQTITPCQCDVRRVPHWKNLLRQSINSQVTGTQRELLRSSTLEFPIRARLPSGSDTCETCHLPSLPMTVCYYTLLPMTSKHTVQYLPRAQTGGGAKR